MDPNGFQNVDYQNEKESLQGYPSCSSSVTLAQVQMTSQCPQNLDYVDDEIFNELFPQKESDQGYGNDPDAGNPFRSQNENVDMIRSSLLQRNGLQSSSSSGLSGQTLSEREQSRANSISNFKMYLLQDPPTTPSSGQHSYLSGHGVVPSVVHSQPAVKTEPIEPGLSPERDYLQQQLGQQPSTSRLLSSSSSTSNNNSCLRDIASSSSSCNQQQLPTASSSTSAATSSTALAATSSSSNSNSYKQLQDCDTQSNHSFKSESDADKLVSEIIKSEPIDVEEFTQKRSKRGRKRKTTDSENELKASYDKESNEYKKKRLRNNIAVRKSRDKAKQRQVEQQNRLVAMAKDLNNARNLINHMKDEKAKMCSQLDRYKRFIATLPMEHQPDPGYFH